MLPSPVSFGSSPQGKEKRLSGGEETAGMKNYSFQGTAVNSPGYVNVRVGSEVTVSAAATRTEQTTHPSSSEGEQDPPSLRKMETVSIKDDPDRNYEVRIPNSTAVVPINLASSRRKRKRNKANGKDKGKFSKRQRKREPLTGSVKDLSSSSIFKGLGSLTSFMDTRGLRKTHIPNDSVARNSSPISAIAAAASDCHVPNASINEPEVGNQDSAGVDTAAFEPTLVQERGHSETPPAILFLSTSLLKTHTPLILALEGTLPEPPPIVYRDYHRTDDTPRAGGLADSIPEADIIVSPTAGIILTTSQATTQRYLPGHKPNLPLQVKDAKEINSPLRERIFRLYPRYEYLYVFVCHAVNEDVKNGLHQAPMAQKWLLSSMTALGAFCASLSRRNQEQGGRYCSSPPAVIPIFVSTRPAAIVSWIYELANKHAVPGCAAFAEYANETRWELFLRATGLNPFAARTILRALALDQGSCTRDSADDNSSLSRFIEMGSEERRHRFQELVGRCVFEEVESVIDRDWQCDWALDFSAM